jgi:hypothetical protein
MKEVDHKSDRKFLLGLCQALSVSKKNLARDELDYWRIVGRKGFQENTNFIDTDGKYWYLHIFTENPRIWGNIQKRLPDMGKWLIGDDEGVLRLDSYPDEILSNKIRGLLGLRWAKKPTLEETELLVSRLRKK